MPQCNACSAELGVKYTTAGGKTYCNTTCWKNWKKTGSVGGAATAADSSPAESVQATPSKVTESAPVSPKPVAEAAPRVAPAAVETACADQAPAAAVPAKEAASSESNAGTSAPKGVAQTTDATPVCGGTTGIGCRKKIVSGTVLQAMGSQFHPACFKCSGCGKPCEESFLAKENLPYCAAACVPGSTAPKEADCFGCKKALGSEIVNAMDHLWHPDCFVCSKCGTKFSGGYGVMDGQPACEKCITSEKRVRGDFTACWGCKKEIVEGQVVRALDHDWHPECFTCDVCKKAFFNGKFQMSSGGSKVCGKMCMMEVE